MRAASVIVLLAIASVALTCANFDTTKYGAPKPVVTAEASGSTITINVLMQRQDAANTGLPVYHTVDTKEAGSNVCRVAPNTDALANSAGVAWSVDTTDCDVTYTLEQSLDDIVGSVANNNWTPTLAADGKSITYATTIYSTYSVNSGGNCYYVGFKTQVSFRTALSVDSSESSFVTADKSAKFQFAGLRITTDNNFEIAGTIIPLVPGSSLGEISLKKNSNDLAIPVDVDTCTVAVYANPPTGCAQIYSVPVSSFAGATDLGGLYTTTMNVYENEVVTRPDVTLTYTITYTIPDAPEVVDSDTIQTANALYLSDYTTPRTSSYSSIAAAADNLYIENKITATSPAIPTGYTLRMTEGYLCCVDYAIGTFPTGGCKNAVVGTGGIMEAVSLGAEGTAANGVTLYNADSLVNKKSYRLQVVLNSAYTQAIPHSKAMTCQVQLFSKLQAPPAARRVGGASNLDATFVSAVPFAVQGQVAVSSSSAASVSMIIMVVAFVANMVL